MEEMLNRGIFFGFGLTTGVLASCMAYYFWGKRKDKRKANKAFLWLKKEIDYEVRTKVRKEANSSQCVGCKYWSRTYIDKFCFWHETQVNEEILKRWKQELARIREARSKKSGINI